MSKVAMTMNGNPVSAEVEDRTLLVELIREIRDSGAVMGLDRVAVMAALNIANELLKDRRREPGGSEVGLLDRVRGLRERVESAITRGKQLEI